MLCLEAKLFHTCNFCMASILNVHSVSHILASKTALIKMYLQVSCHTLFGGKTFPALDTNVRLLSCMYTGV